MTLGTCWACQAPDRKAKPAARLAECLTLARRRLGEIAMPKIVFVHPETAKETPATHGLQLVPSEHVGRFNYWFPIGSDGRR
jgi:hypothetical protein